MARGAIWTNRYVFELLFWPLPITSGAFKDGHTITSNQINNNEYKNIHLLEKKANKKY